jgi:hypothetical protein
MTETMPFVNRNEALFQQFPQLFRRLYFNDLQTGRGELGVHKPAPGDSVPECRALKRQLLRGGAFVFDGQATNADFPPYRRYPVFDLDSARRNNHVILATASGLPL